MSNPYIVTYTGDGSQTDFQAPATYIRRAHVTVSVGGVITTAYVWHTDTIIRFNAAPGNGVAIVMTDQAPSGPLNVFSGDTGLSALALNENFKQAVQVGDFAFNAAKDIVGGAIPPNTITGVMLADGAVTAAKTSAGVQASLGKADSALQSSALVNTALTGNPTAPTPAALDNDTSIATTAFVQGEFTAKTVTSDTDVTATRLLKNLTGPAQAFRRGNILGTVSQSGGVPTGAAMELGSNANGNYARFANGFQICFQASFTMVVASGGRMAADWTYPAAFSGNPRILMSTSAASSSYTGTTAGEVGSPQTLGLNSTSVNAGYNYNGVGAGTFTTGDEARDVSLVAIGRWF